MYILEPTWCPPSVEATMDFALHLSNHFPLIANFVEFDWKSHVQGCMVKRPLMINNLHLDKHLFKEHVKANVVYVKSM